MTSPKHHPELLTTGRHGAWCNCTCGWSSDVYKRATGAHLAFGDHLLAIVNAERSEGQES